MNLDELSQAQKETGEQIKSIVSNYRKDSAIRKTADYLQKKLQKLDEQWEQFEAIDDEIRNSYGDQLTHPYFANKYYEAVRQGYEDMRKDVVSRLETVKSTNPPSKNPDPQGSQGTKPKTSEPSTERSQNDTSLDNKPSLLKPNAGIINKQRSIMSLLKRTLLSPADSSAFKSEQSYKIRIKTIERYLEETQRLHEIIWKEINDISTSDYQIEEYFTLEEEAQNELIRLHEALCLHVNNQSNPGTTQLNQNTMPSINLPKIAIPRFDGDYLKWKQFCDLFTELVHNQPIARCQKMWYLKTSLAGEAERLVRHLTTSDMNYDAAWKIIKDRYENARLLTNALLNNLLSQPSIINPTASSIKKLHDTTQECLLGLQNMGLDTANWDPLLLYILVRKLDKVTHTLYEQSLKQPRELQSLQQFLAFLEVRFQSLEALGSKGRPADEQSKHSSSSRPFMAGLTTGSTCTLCKGNHLLFACQKFLQLTPQKRLEHVKGAKLCINCLKSGHNSNSCPSRACTKCSKRHNTLLHLEITSNQLATTTRSQLNTQASASSHNVNRSTMQDKSQPVKGQAETHSASLTTNAMQSKGGYVLLSTVLVKLIGTNGRTIVCRAILDSGSQLNFVTERIVKRLKLNEVADLISIEGIGQRRHQTQRRVNLLLQSQINGFATRVEAHVLPRIISPQPAQSIDISSWSIPKNIPLADPRFNHPDSIDLLIGAEIFHSLLAVGQIKLGDGLPIMQNTVFGWTLAGKIHQQPLLQAMCGICTEDNALELQIEKFWRLEDSERPSNNLTAAERQCEAQFAQTTRRDSRGRFIVSLPFKADPSALGESRDIAYQRFISLERRLGKDPELKRQYVQFMEEYAKLGHMEEIDINRLQRPYYFLPHHCVIKPESSTTRLRVVFDASANTSSNLSLNDILHTGPTIQDDLFSILLRFRMPRFTFTADIEKMYRQVYIEQSDRKYQLIWWRDDSSQSVKCFQLNTVTYGTTCAPYLATKCLKKLADDHAVKYPLGSKVLKHDFYVDDALAGADSLSTAIETQQQLQALLHMAGFRLRKWCANHPRLMQDIPLEDREIQLNFENKVEEHVKTVGLIWLPKTDEFSIKTSWIEGRKITKRTAYSDIAHLFDPLGIMAPVVVVAKIFLQRLWALKLDWDAALPQDLHTSWAKFREGLKSLHDIKFPRHVYSHRTPKLSQIHIFADASEKAYGAAAYVRAIDQGSIVTVRLLCAKSRVAPVNRTTLPRLELCAAKLAAELARRVNIDLNINNENIYLWSDSEIVLAWINSTSSSFHTFVANRVSRIQELTVSTQWRHVSSKDNPADILSRGLAPEKLRDSTLWFYGPLFLHGAETIWPLPYKNDHTDYMVEHKRIALPATYPEDSSTFINSIDHKNSFKKLLRIVAYTLRFITHVRKRNKSPTRSLVLHAKELDEAQTVIIRTIQQEHFKQDITSLTRYGEVSKTSSLSSLTPFLDEQGMLRVGGRLEASNLSFDAKHPMLLPYSHQVTKLILMDIHQRNHHVGPQTLLAIARQKYWPIKGKTLARSVVQHCIFCARTNPKMLSQLMGNLPADRVQPSRPFVSSGVDFCGPIYTHFRIRGKHPQKSYIAVFCCFATKATHLEVVSDLTTQGFIGALKRFMGRRGHCRKIYCDNATNFVGAKNELQELRQMLESEETNGKIAAVCNDSSTEFHLIPPRAPHFGGLWEAAVKSAKHLLKRTLASASLTYEELETAVIEVEAILNSRPITSNVVQPQRSNSTHPRASAHRRASH